MIYRVRSTEQPVVYYAGHSFEVASWRFDQEVGGRIMERRAEGGWRDVMTYSPGREWK